MWKKKIIDVTGIPLTPSLQGKRCLGNGSHPGYECCCDECDYALYCYPQFNDEKGNRFIDWLKIWFR